MSEQDDMLDGLRSLQRERLVYMVLAVVAIAMITLVFVFGLGPFSGDHEGTVSQQWCEQHGGEVVYSHVLGDHGGLHCLLDNGSVYDVDADGAAEFNAGSADPAATTRGGPP